MRFAKTALSIRLSSGKYSCATWCNEFYPFAKDRDRDLMCHRSDHPIARARGREMHNALTEGNGITKHIICRYGNVNSPQVAFLSALCPCIPFLFYPLFLSLMLNHIRQGVCCYNIFTKHLSFPKVLSIPSVLAILPSFFFHPYILKC